MFVIPRPILARARQHPLIRSVYPTDMGWFPRAAHHYRKRLDGARQDHLMLCVGGHGYVDISGHRAHLQQGEIILIPRDTPHTYWAADGDPWSIYWVHFLGDDVDYYVDRIPRRGQPVPVEPSAQDEAVRLFRYCLEALNDGYGMPTLIYASQSTQHILSLLLYRNQSLPMEQRSGEVSHFSDRFRAQTGQSPMAYFIHLKMRLACRLLDLSKKPVKTVAIETGYRDPYYFSRVFKKSMGISPEKYRNIKKG
jgi:hypothetical protein